MRHAGFTRQERSFITLMRVWTLAFLGVAGLIAAIPDVLLNYINEIGRVFAGWQSPAIAAGGELWRVHSVVLHLCLAYSCAIAQGSALRNAAYARFTLVATFACAFGTAAMLFIDGLQFYYLVAAAADGVAFLMTLWLYSGSSKSRG